MQSTLVVTTTIHGSALVINGAYCFLRYQCIMLIMNEVKHKTMCGAEHVTHIKATTINSYANKNKPL